LTADFAATFLYSQPIDFNLSCTGEITSSYESCKLNPDLPQGDAYIGSWSGELLVPAEGVYTFWLSSTLDHRHPDDNARLRIDGALVADWWWDAPHRSPATATLSAGLHDILIVYAQRAKDRAALQVRWAGPGFEAEVIPVYGFPDDGPPCPSPQNEEGGPVNTKSGNYIYQASDLQLQTLAGPLSFERTYSAQAVDTFSDDLLGYGWTHNHNRQLVFPDDPGGEADTVILRGENGSSLRFWQVATGAGQYRYEPRPEVRAEMVMRAGDDDTPLSYVITASNQSVLTFTGHDPLLRTYRDPYGNVLTYTYRSGWLSRVSDASGRYLAFDVEWVEGLGDGEDEL
jgi:hypothetical protein